EAARGVGPLQGAGRSGSASGRGGAGGSLLFLDPVPQLVAPGGETLARLEEARQGTARCDVAEVVLDQLDALLAQRVVLDEVASEAPDARGLGGGEPRGHAQQRGRGISRLRVLGAGDD